MRFTAAAAAGAAGAAGMMPPVLAGLTSKRNTSVHIPELKMGPAMSVRKWGVKNKTLFHLLICRAKAKLPIFFYGNMR